MRLPLRIEQLGHIRDRDGLGAPTARYEDVRLITEVGRVAEVGTVRNDLARGEGDVNVFDQNDVAVLAELGPIKVGDHLAGLGEAHEFTAVDAVGVGKNPRTVDDCDVLLVAEKYLVGAEI